MNRTAAALILKLVITIVAALIAFSLITTNPVGMVVLVGVVATIVNYLLGDLAVLPKYGNTAASIGDGILALLVAYIINLLTPAFNTNAASLVAFLVLIAVAEYFFHRYLLRSDKVAP